MAKQIYDLEKDEYVDVAETTTMTEEKTDKSETKEEESEEEEEDEESESEEKKDDEKEEEAESESKEESEDDESGEDEDEKKSAEAKKKESEKKDDDEEEEEDEVDADKFIADNFEEEYGIKSKKEFEEILDVATVLDKENKDLKKELEEAKKAPKGPVFKSKTQEKIYDMLKDYDPERISGGLYTIAALIDMDADKTDAKLVLQQEFILNHPELPLDRAIKKFQKRYNEKYVVDEENWTGTPEELAEKKEDLEDDLKIDMAKAKKFIKEKQAEIKTQSSEEKEEKPAITKEVQQSIEKNVADFDSHMDGLNSLIFEDENDPKLKFTYKFKKEQLKQIKEAINGHLKNPSAYSEKGELVGGFDPETKFQQAAYALFGEEIIVEALKNSKNIAQIMKVEEVGKKHPQRKAKSSGDVKAMDIDSQAERIAEQKRAEREGRRA